jgi:cysteine-rich repeat protein
MMASLARLPLLVAALAIGCSTRALDSRHDAGGSGSFGVDGGGASDARPDLASIEVSDQVRSCGNGTLDPGEECDDGNTRQDDGCTFLCQIPCNWNCGSCGAPTPCITVRVCGDGVLASSESCDDGNTIDGDGCAGDCTAIEAGWRCPVPGRRCFPICGDRLTVGPETCDDGNHVSGDGCSAICLVEPDSARCGDGVISGAEQCDDGADNGSTIYGGCTSDCLLGGYCGDGVTNGFEDCDLGAGRNVAGYGATGGCAPGCHFPHFCGDGIVDESDGEQCDLASRNGTPGSACTNSCKIAIDL